MSTGRIGRFTWRHRIGWGGIALAVLSWMGGCSSESDSDAFGPPGITPSAIVVSDPVAASAPADGIVVGTGGASSRGDVTQAYVSLAEGEIPTGTSASIRNWRTGSTMTTPMLAGGFDPVAVEASAGDTLEVKVEVSSGPTPLSFLLRVPATAPPIVVRTEPAEGKRDVPLNARIIIVFSEPIDGATLTGTTIRLKRGLAEVAGVVRFDDPEQLTVEFVPDEPLVPSTEYQLEITQGIEDLDGDSLEAAVGVGFTTSSATAARLAFTVHPSDAVEGSPISPAVEVTVQDALGNTVTDFTDGITLALGQNPGGASLAGTTTVAAVGGVATFADLRVGGSGVGFTLTAAAAGLSGATSATFQVVANSARLVFTVQPSNTILGLAISPAVEVEVQDAFGNIVSFDAADIAVSLGQNPGGGSLTGTTNTKVVGGKATFANLHVDRSGVGYTLLASTAGLMPAMSAAFEIETNTPESGFGSVTGRVLDAATDTMLVDVAAPQMLAAPISDPTKQQQYDLWDQSTGSVLFGRLSAGTWTIAVSVIHGWSWVFPGLHLYADTTLTVDVVAGETTVLPDLLLRPRAPLLLVGVERCPWALPDPPTQEDWGNCDSGYWGGVDVQIEVNGVAGTSTAGVHYEALIGPAEATWLPTSWDDTPWSAHFDIAIPGEYDVRLVDVAPSSSGAIWELVPWRPASTRVRVEQGLAYVEFEFWYK